jgi:hypothetical protein
LKISKGQSEYIEEEQTTQWPKEKSTKEQTTIFVNMPTGIIAGNAY